MSLASGRQAQERAEPPRRQERAIGAFVLIAGILLETLPVTAWLILLAAMNGLPNEVLFPIWWVALLILFAWAVGTLQREGPSTQREHEDRRLGIRVLVALGWLLTFFLSLFVSPIVTGNLGVGPILIVVVVVTYFWWRGLRLGSTSLSQERLNVRFLVGLAVIILAVVSASTLRGVTRNSEEGSLALLLQIEVFVALTGIALAHLLDTAHDHNERRLRGRGDAGATFSGTGAWILTSLGVSAAVAIVAFALTLLISYDTVRAVVAVLGPIWDVIVAALSWLAHVLAYVLFLLFNPLVTWVLSLEQPLKPLSTSPSTPPSNPTHSQQLPPVSEAWQTAGSWALYVIAAVAAVSLLLLALRRIRQIRQSYDFEEERESLDGRAILGAQLRALLDGLRRRDADDGQEALASGSVRLLYRDALTASGHVGLGRRPAETPDEFAQRLSRDTLKSDGAEPAAGQALTELTDAYDAARYDEHLQNEIAPPTVVAAQTSLLGWLHGYARTHSVATESHGRRWPFRRGNS